VEHSAAERQETFGNPSLQLFFACISCSIFVILDTIIDLFTYLLTLQLTLWSCIFVSVTHPLQAVSCHSAIVIYYFFLLYQFDFFVLLISNQDGAVVLVAVKTCKSSDNATRTDQLLKEAGSSYIILEISIILVYRCIC